MISVCMTTYNGERFLKEQIDSILLQLSPDDEIVVSDDGSTDNTLLILEGYNDKRIKLIKHTKEKQKYIFGYTTRNMENALLNSSGSYIFMADQDDVWLPNKVSLMLPLLQKYDLVLADCKDVDSNLAVLYESHFALVNTKLGTVHNLIKSGYLGSNMCFTRKFMTTFLPIPENVPHDLWIGLVCNLSGSAFLLVQVTMLYRRHDGNVSSTNHKLLNKQNNQAIALNRNNHSFLFKIRYRLIIVKSLLSYEIRRKLSRLLINNGKT